VITRGCAEPANLGRSRALDQRATAAATAVTTIIASKVLTTIVPVHGAVPGFSRAGGCALYGSTCGRRTARWAGKDTSVFVPWALVDGADLRGGAEFIASSCPDVIDPTGDFFRSETDEVPENTLPDSDCFNRVHAIQFLPQRNLEPQVFRALLGECTVLLACIIRTIGSSRRAPALRRRCPPVEDSET
jgi:hypothetical protein